MTAALLLLMAAAIYTVWIEPGEEEEQIVYKEETAAFGDLTQGIMESGSISLETKEQSYDIVIDEDEDDEDEDEDEEETRHLKIEEVYVSQGQRVLKGDAILKLTQQSVKSVRRYLEAERADAQISLEDLENEYETSQTDAQNTYRKSMIDAQWSQAQYAIDLQKITLEIAKLNDSISVLEQEIKQTETDLADGWDDFADLKEEYEKWKRRYEEWDKDNLYTYVPMRTEYLAAKEKYEEEQQARLDKRQEMSDKQEEIETIREDIARLEGQVERNELTTRQTYESAALGGSIAQETYDYSLRALTVNIDTAQKELDDLQEKLEDFDTFVGEDGIVYAQGDGLITQVYYEAGDTLTEESALFTYVQEDAYVLSVDISEEDIPGIAVGDEVTIVFTAYPDETYNGRVTQIVSTQTSQGTATVSYPVTVSIEGDTSKLYGGMTGSVTFVTDEITQAVYVSRKAVTEENGKSYVLVKDENEEMVRKEVETGFTDGVHIQIVSGISEGDTVYIESRVSAKELAEDVKKEETDESMASEK